MKLRKWIACGMLFVAFGAGCLAVGNSPKMQIPTLGQELSELKESLDQGAINTAEYQQAKETILSGNRQAAAIKTADKNLF